MPILNAFFKLKQQACYFLHQACAICFWAQKLIQIDCPKDFNFSFSGLSSGDFFSTPKTNYLAFTGCFYLQETASCSAYNLKNQYSVAPLLFTLNAIQTSSLQSSK